MSRDVRKAVPHPLIELGREDAPPFLHHGSEGIEIECVTVPIR